MSQTVPPIFGYVKLVHQTLIQLYSANAIAASQISFVLGKLLPMGVDLWVGTELPDRIPDDWIPLEVSEIPSGSEVPDERMRQELHSRAQGWWSACRHVVARYHQRFSPDLEEVRVIETIPEEEIRDE